MNDFVAHAQGLVADKDVDSLTASAVGSFVASVSNCREPLKEESVRAWIADMILGGMRSSTRRKYFSRVHTIYSLWKTEAGTDPFLAVRDDLNFDFDAALSEASRNLEAVHRLLSNPESTGSEYVALFLYLLYNVTATVSDAVNLKFEDVTADCPQIDNLIDSLQRSSRRAAYVFPTVHSRPRELNPAVDAALQRYGLIFSGGFSRDRVTELWIAAAIKAGVSLQDVRSMLPNVPSGFKSLEIIPAIPLTDRCRAALIRRVADTVNVRISQWFVMRLRQGHTPDDIQKRIRLTEPDIYETMHFYYPTHKAMRQGAGKKMASVDVPYMPGILFFKMPSRTVPKLFSRIGDVAWCYKHTKSSSGGYCTISRSEMMAFQRHIGEFTPDIQMDLRVSENPIEAGTVVRISGGGRMVGATAVVESVRNANGSRTYSLRLTDYLEARWTVDDVAEVFIEKV